MIKTTTDFRSFIFQIVVLEFHTSSHCFPSASAYYFLQFFFLRRTKQNKNHVRLFLSTRGNKQHTVRDLTIDVCIPIVWRKSSKKENSSMFKIKRAQTQLYGIIFIGFELISIIFDLILITLSQHTLVTITFQFMLHGICFNRCT